MEAACGKGTYCTSDFPRETVVLPIRCRPKQDLAPTCRRMYPHSVFAVKLAIDIVSAFAPMASVFGHLKKHNVKPIACIKSMQRGFLLEHA